MHPGITTEALRDLYRSSKAFVLPSRRGEGWVRPHVEAMSMELPVIATFWSGPTEQNSYPVQVEKFEEIADGPFKGHRWAKPSILHLQFQMRRVISNPEEARGIRARFNMQRNAWHR
jgi:glycosyltransferase involved in cell wall biosynthesis